MKFNVLSKFNCISEIIVHSSPLDKILNKRIILKKEVLEILKTNR